MKLCICCRMCLSPKWFHIDFLFSNLGLIIAQQISIHTNCFMAGGWHTSCHPISKMHCGRGAGESPSALKCLSYLSRHSSVASFASHSLQPLTVAIQAPLSMGFFKQEYWNGLSSPPPGDLPSPGIKPKLPASPALENSLPLSHQRNPLSQVYPTAKILLTKRNF